GHHINQTHPLGILPRRRTKSDASSRDPSTKENNNHPWYPTKGFTPVNQTQSIGISGGTVWAPSGSTFTYKFQRHISNSSHHIYNESTFHNIHNHITIHSLLHIPLFHAPVIATN
ncbi:hypothetical protein LINPERHAP1_LOCUS17909, partial [Linum perenne]